MSLNHAPNNDLYIVPTRVNYRSQLLHIRSLDQRPHYAIDQFTTAMEELAVALRKAKRPSKWNRRVS